MRTDQLISNVPAPDWKGPLFKLSDKFPATPQDDSGAQPWRAKKYDKLFAADTSPAERSALAKGYSWDLMHYIQAGNIDAGDRGGDVATDWTLCNNKVRNWYHMPFQTYDTLSGREFVHGLTREAPVTFSMKDPADPSKSVSLPSTVWAVGFYNPTAAHTLGTVWGPEGAAKVPTSAIAFEEGAVIGKLLFTTLSPVQLPFLRNLPAWKANLSATDFCTCKPKGAKPCSMSEQSRACPRSLTTGNDGLVALMQFDVAVKDARAPGTGWVYGTFVADGERKASERNPWNRIAALGLMWGNDPPPAGGYAAQSPADPRNAGFQSAVIFWDVVDMLNAAGGDVIAKRPGHLGCNSRLNGPADNASSSCLSCHMTASVPDKKLTTPPILAQFGGLTPECVTPTGPNKGTDAGGAPATVKNGISFSQIDGIYFADTACGSPVNMTVTSAAGQVNVLGRGVPSYADGQTAWIPLDFSLQLSISLTQWGEWQQDRPSLTPGAAVPKAKPAKAHVFESRLPAR
jgi:hypothetical protein